MSSHQSKKRKKIWEGARVKIIEPRFFIRCGYTLYPEMFLEESAKKVSEFMKTLGYVADKYATPMLKMSWELAYIQAKSKSFGGRDRKIFEIDGNPDLKLATCYVRKAKRVVTGTWFSGHDGGYYPEDAEGPTLEHQKHHTVLRLDNFAATYIEGHTGLTKTTRWMLAEHVVRIPENYETAANSF